MNSLVQSKLNFRFLFISHKFSFFYQLKFKDGKPLSREATQFNQYINYQEDNDTNTNSLSGINEESAKNLSQTNNRQKELKTLNTGQNVRSLNQVSSQACLIQ
jgi:hypothetical protein